MHLTFLRRRGAAIALAAAGFGLAGAGQASAATLAVDGGVLRYTAAPNLTNAVDFDETGAAEVTVTRRPADGDEDPITEGTGCTEENATTFVCTGVTSVNAEAGNEDDDLNASALATIPATLNGGDGADVLSGGAANDTLNGGNGDDDLDGNAGNDTVNGDAGNDGALGGAGDDRVDGGAGDEQFLDGGAGNDTVTGGDGDEFFVAGGAGNDTVDGGAGTDFVSGGTGNDTVNGGTGDDALANDFTRVVNAPAGSPAQEPDADVFSGGEGFDRLLTSATQVDLASGAFTPLDVTVTLDDQANDGASGENDDVRRDVEGVTSSTSADSNAGGNDRLTGSDGINELDGGAGNDTIDGGAGNDVLSGGSGDDTFNAQDGFADFVSCGAGNDTANVDTLDTVSTDCETVNRRDVGNANEDRPPTVTITSPTAGRTLATRAPTTVTANVADDRGVAQVLYIANGRIVCVATAAPYTCTFQPTGADVGRTQLTAVAIDTSQQTGTDLRAVNVPRFAPRTLSATVSPRRDRRRPFRFRVTGRLTLPAGVSAAQGCTEGSVSVQIKAGKRTISTRRARLSRNCLYSRTVVFTDPRRFRGARRLKVTARFAGNKVLGRKTAAARFARVR